MTAPFHPGGAPYAFDRVVREEEQRHTRAIVDIARRFPPWRLHIAFAMLGAAIAVVDSYGGDVEGFLAHLRQREPKPTPIVPPKEGAS